MENNNVKPALYEKCSEFIAERIQTATIALQQAREASNDDTKSSAGDKYETSREMMQQDIDRNKRLLMDAEENQRILIQLKDVPGSEIVRNGSLVFTDQGNFYLSVSAGMLKLNEQVYFAISSASPIGKLLSGKRTGESFEFNGKKYLVNEIL